MADGRSPTPAWLAYAGLLAVFVAVIAAGYAGFRAFASSDLSSANLYLLAVVAGVDSFFSPCAFPLLPSYLSLLLLNSCTFIIKYRVVGKRIQHSDQPERGQKANEPDPARPRV